MKRVTINDIARQLNVSACTVSKILNGKGNFSEPMKQLVVDTASEMGYTPNRLAEALVRRTLKILIITTDEWPDYVGQLKRGVESQIKRLNDFNVYGIYLELHRSQEVDILVNIISEELHNEPDAVILCGSDIFYIQPPILHLLHAITCPLILVGLDAPQIHATALVSHDSYLSGVMAAELLSSMVGEGEVAISICNQNVPDSVAKLEGFTSEAKRCRLNITKVMEADDNPNKGSELMADCLRHNSGLRGVYFATDNSSSACEVISRSAQAAKLRVVATGAFPDVVKNMQRGIVQAALYQNMHQQGKLGVRLAYRLLTGSPTIERSILLAPAIVVNSNCETVKNNDLHDLLYVI